MGVQINSDYLFKFFKCSSVRNKISSDLTSLQSLQSLAIIREFRIIQKFNNTFAETFIWKIWYWNFLFFNVHFHTIMLH